MPRYGESSLKSALHAIEHEKCSINSAAVKYGVPEATLRYKIVTNSNEIKKRGRAPLLSKSEESDIHQWMITCAERGK